MRVMGKRAKARSLTVAGSVVDSGAGPAPLERQDLRQRVVGRIVELIRTGNLRPGDRLPPERELVEIFSISRPSLREAMRALSTLGIVESRHGGGTFVTDLDARTLLAPLDFFLQLSQVNLDDTFESRRIVEIEIVRKAAAQASRADILDLNDMIAAHAKIQKDPVGFRILDSRFHEKLSAIAGNAVLQRVAYGLYNMDLHIRRRATAEPGLIAESTADHTEIAAAIAAHDPEGAAAAMARHLSHIKESTERTMASQRFGVVETTAKRPAR
jgi:GntR family transcriptional repressor for pyruvate dehydrogenase complex